MAIVVISLRGPRRQPHLPDMKTSRLLAPAWVVVIALSGCATHTAPTTTGTSYVSELGDQSSVGLDEIVVSLPLHGSSANYQNLHLCLAVAINPVHANPNTPDTSSKAYSGEVESLVRRLGPRINATVSAALQERSQAQLNNMTALRKQAASLTESVLTEAMRNWKYASDYKIEVLVMNSYWTDASVGLQSKPASPRW